MQALIRQLVAVTLLAVVCLYALSVPGGEVAASGHEHMHMESSGEWTHLLGKLKTLAETSAIMVLVGVFLFRTALLPAAGERGAWPTIERIERIAAVAALYALILTDSGNTMTIVKVAIAIVWLLAAWEMIPQSKISTATKGLCAAVMVPFIHMESIGTLLSIPGLVALLITSIYTVSGAVWVGGGISIYAALARKPELPGSELRLLLTRFMTWAAVASCGMVLSGLFSLLQVSNAQPEWKSSPEGILTLFKLLLILLIVWVASDGYQRWRRAGDEEMRSRFRYKQSLRFSLSLTVLVLLLSALITSPAPGGGVLKEPIYWHVMGEEAHMSLRIREQNGGGQHVRLDIWLPSGLGKPISAEVTLYHEELAVEVPVLYKEGGPDPYGFEGFDKYTYEVDGRFIAASGSWTMKVVVIDENLEQFAYEKIEVIP